MEHLFQVMGAPSKCLEFPYYGLSNFNEYFDVTNIQASFEQYPSEQGWEISHFRKLDFLELSHKRSSQVIAKFIQSWLYFGLLSAILGIPVDPNRFITKNQNNVAILTTRHLMEELEAWKSRLGLISEESLDNLLYENEAIITFASRIIAAINNPSPPYHSLPGELGLSTALIGTVLGHATSVLLGQKYQRRQIITRKGFWGIGMLLHNSLVEQGWCPNDVLRFTRCSFVSGLCLAVTMGRKERVNHQNCSEERCSANDCLDDDVYDIRHEHKQQDDCQFVRPQIFKIHTAFDEASFPLLHVSDPDKNGDVKINVSTWKPGVEYVALSHVWSDGLGNPKENAIPTCQAIRIQELVNELHKHRTISPNGPYLFWLDTLCVPKGESNNYYRHQAIRQMAQTYKCASIVLVLDRELEQYSTDIPAVEKLMRISCCAWMRRVWTLQEAVLSDKIYVRFSDGFLHLDRAVDDLLEWRQGNRFFFDTVPSEMCNFYLQMRQITDTSGSDKLIHAWDLINTRQTSHAGDEIICLASMLGVDPQKLLEEKSPEIRMKIFFSMLPEVPYGMLFFMGRRLEDEGYRWAPRSLFKGIVIYTMGQAPLRRNTRGLFIEAKGLILQGRWRNTDKKGNTCLYKIANTEKWIKISQWDIWHLYKLTKKIVSPETKAGMTEFEERFDKEQYENAQDGGAEMVRLGLITGAEQFNHLTRAVLVSHCRKEGNTMFCRYERILQISYADVEDIKAVAENIGQVAEWTSSSQEWCVA